MLKFSGFSDLTSCLWWIANAAREVAPNAQTKRREAQSIVVAQGLDALHASRARRRLDVQKLTAIEAKAGMKRSRH